MEQRNPTFKERLYTRWNAMQKWQKGLLVLVIVLAAYLLFSDAWAGTGGSEFDSMLTMVEGWIKGKLAKLIAFVALLVALIAGAGGNTKAALGALALLAIIATGPAIIDSMFTAVI